MENNILFRIFRSPVAQLVEHRAVTREVAGSNPRLVLFRDSLLPRPENGPGTQAGKERVLYYLQAHARNDAIFSPKTGGKKPYLGKRFLIWA